MQVIITMAGLGQRFIDQGYLEPKPFIKIKDKCVIEYLVERFPKTWKLFFVINEDLNQKYIDFLTSKFLNSKVIVTQYSERGPIDTVQAALPHIQLDMPTIVSYCDFSIDWNAEDFELAVEGFDAAVVGYTGFQPTFLGPNSYCHYLVDGERVIELQEKVLYTGKLETEWTSCGLYYFKTAEFLKKCLVAQDQQKLCYQGQEYYTSLAIQAMLNLEPKISVLNYQIKKFFQFGTPFDVEWFLKNNPHHQ
jgi:NDP-sugar pyrophosphorylase family protein